MELIENPFRNFSMPDLVLVGQSFNLFIGEKSNVCNLNEVICLSRQNLREMGIESEPNT